VTATKTGRLAAFLPRLFRLVYPLVSVLLFGLYPVLYFYQRNVQLVLFSSLARVLLIYLLLIIVVYLVCLLLNRGNSIRAANAAAVFMLFFNTYGILFRFILEKDLLTARHYTLLPLWIFIAVYLAWLTSRLRPALALNLWRAVALIFAALAVVSLVGIVPTEINKAQLQRKQYADAAVTAPVGGIQDPDIYYLLFDEFTGFKAVREYWKIPEADAFKTFLEEKGFYIIEDSHGFNTVTLHQMASRLNHTELVGDDKEETQYYELIADNQVMSYLKSRGYTTVVFDEISWPYPAMPAINADYLYELDLNDNSDFGMIFDDFGVLIIDNTMLFSLSQYYQLEGFGYRPHRNMILSTVERVGNMDDIPSPKFIYSHLMIPHRPYLFDAEGNPVDSEYYRNWEYYPGYWVYSTGIIRQMVENILADADPANPPVIILQSDHGARLHRDPYTEEQRTNILFAVYLPGYDTSSLLQDENPVNTFPLIFNHYFGEDFLLR